jgi:hypothetical protein
VTLAERTSIYVPALPLAQWFVSKWWAMLYEPNRWEHVPTGEALGARQPEWLHRHCLRSAEAGLLLPRLLKEDDRALIGRPYLHSLGLRRQPTRSRFTA